MPKIVQSIGAISLDDLSQVFNGNAAGSATNVSLSGFYRVSPPVNIPPGNASIPASGSISLSDFYGTEGPSRTVLIHSASGTFTPPEGITKAYVIVVAGGGGGGGGFYRSYTGDLAGANTSGGTGGEGGMAIGTVTLTPGTAYTVTVGAGGAGSDTTTGGTGGTSSFSGLSASGGLGGGAGTSSGTGVAGANGTASGGNIYNGNVNASDWSTNLNSTGWQTSTVIGSFNSTNRTTMTTLSNQTIVNNTNLVMTARAWSSTGTVRPGCGGAGEQGGDYSYFSSDAFVSVDSPDSSGGYNGAVIIIY